MTRIFRHEPVDFRALPPAVRGLMAAQAAGFALSWLVGPQLHQLFGLVPARLLSERWIWQPFTYLFLHGNLWHLVFNIFALWMFGVPVESQWGARDFLKYFFLCGFGGAAAAVALAHGSTAPVIGSSGAVYGLLVAFAMLYPDAVVYLYFLIPIRAAHMAVLFGLLEFFAGLSGATPGVSRFAHLGGMVVGYLYIRWWWVAKLRLKSLWRGAAEAPGRRAARPAAPRRAAEEARRDEMAQMDRILDKILASGLESLTDAERELMRRYSQRREPS